VIIRRSTGFRKAFKKRIKNDSKLVKKTTERIQLFLDNPQNPVLKDHQLIGKLKNNRSFWVTGDVRIVYFQISKDEVLFIDIGSHNQVY